MELFYPSAVVSIGSTDFTYNSTLTAPPASAQIRFDAAYPYTAATKIFVSSTSGTGADVHAAMMVILAGSICYIEDADNHLQWARFETLTAPIDHSTYVEIPVKWVANGTAFTTAQTVKFYAPSAGGQALPHHQTHETGGTDAITKLDAAVIQTGTLLDTLLSPQVALTTRINHFAQPQYLDGQPLVVRDVAAAATTKDFRIYHAGGYLRFEGVNEVSGAPWNTPLMLALNGDVWTNAPIHVASGNASLYLRDTGVAANTGQFRIMSQSSQLRFFKQDDAESGFMVMMSLDRTGNMVVSGALNSGALSVTGGINATGAIVAGANLQCTGNIHSQGFVYPGRADTAGIQSSWFLASHASYGLYTNTGFYVVGPIFTAQDPECGQQYLGVRQYLGVGQYHRVWQHHRVGPAARHHATAHLGVGGRWHSSRHESLRHDHGRLCQCRDDVLRAAQSPQRAGVDHPAERLRGRGGAGVGRALYRGRRGADSDGHRGSVEVDDDGLPVCGGVGSVVHAGAER